MTSNIQRFTVYRRNISERATHNENTRNADDAPQFEGVIFTDGSVAIRWMTASKSTSLFSSIDAMLDVHGHPEYGTEILWHDAEAPRHWVDLIYKYFTKA